MVYSANYKNRPNICFLLSDVRMQINYRKKILNSRKLEPMSFRLLLSESSEKERLSSRGCQKNALSHN